MTELKDSRVKDLHNIDDLIDAVQIRPVSEADRDRIKKSGWIITDKFISIVFSSSQDIKENKALKDEGETEFSPVSGYFIGPYGSGKTATAEKIAEFLGLPFLIINCHPEIDQDDLIYSQELVDNGKKTVYKESALLKTAESGGVILLDSVDVIKHQGVLTCMNRLLDEGIVEIPSVDSPTGQKRTKYKRR